MGDSPALTFLADDRYVGEGVSLGLARGLLGCYRGRNITQEGMGLGAVALRLGPFTYFAGTCETRTLAEGQFTKTFSLDRRLMWSLGKRSSVTLTRALAQAAARRAGGHYAHPPDTWPQAVLPARRCRCQRQLQLPGPGQAPDCPRTR